MSEFKCEVVQVKIIPHHNADKLEVALVKGYSCVVQKGKYKTGDKAIYIPEQAILPQDILITYGFWDKDQNKGTLSGTLGNRVNATRLRGVISQGLVISHPDLLGYELGTDVKDILGITKYVPPIPRCLTGTVLGPDINVTIKYDFDDIKKNPDMFVDGEEVIITEKIHGTLLQIGVVPKSMENEKYYKGRIILSSKGLSAKGMYLDHNDDTNVYVQASKHHDLLNKALEHLDHITKIYNKPVFLLGEIFGKTASGGYIQDLQYTGEKLGYRAFDIAIGTRNDVTYLSYDKFKEITVFSLVIPTVPVLYKGKYSKEILEYYTTGFSTLSPKTARVTEKREDTLANTVTTIKHTKYESLPPHIREGVVIKSAIETKDQFFKRKIAKSINPEYLFRKGNRTEYQ